MVAVAVLSLPLISYLLLGLAGVLFVSCSPASPTDGLRRRGVSNVGFWYRVVASVWVESCRRPHERT